MTRESEWTDNQRNLMLALDQYEAELCQCGNHLSITEDPANVFMPTERVCKICAGMDQFTRLQQSRDEIAEKAAGRDTPAQTPRPSDGRQTYMRPVSPAEVAEIRERRRTRHQSQ